MTITCAGPNAEVGVALRIADFVDCQARALGENGFNAIIRGPIAEGLLFGSMTVFVSLVGYRLLTGDKVGRTEAVGKVARFVMVLALLTGWPAFQSLVYAVATDGPTQLASLLLPTVMLPHEGSAHRVQRSYDRIRLGGVTDAEAQPLERVRPARATESPPVNVPTNPGFEARPLVATALVVSTVGTTAALKVAIGFLLAIAPLAVLALLFDATLGLFNGWVRALAGAALAVLGSTIVTAITLVSVEHELGNLQAWSDGSRVGAADPVALTTIVLLFVLVMLATVSAAIKMAGAFQLSTGTYRAASRQRGFGAEITSSARIPDPAIPVAVSRPKEVAEQRRAALVAEALAFNVRREQSMIARSVADRRQVDMLQSAADISVYDLPLGVAGLRTKVRRASSAIRRDRR